MKLWVDVVETYPDYHLNDNDDDGADWYPTIELSEEDFAAWRAANKERDRIIGIIQKQLKQEA